MRNSEEQIDMELEKLKQSILDMSQEKPSQQKERYSFHKRL